MSATTRELVAREARKVGYRHANVDMGTADTYNLGFTSITVRFNRRGAITSADLVRFGYPMPLHIGSRDQHKFLTVVAWFEGHNSHDEAREAHVSARMAQVAERVRAYNAAPSVSVTMSNLDRAMAPLARTGHDVHSARIVDTMSNLDRAMRPVVVPSAAQTRQEAIDAHLAQIDAIYAQTDMHVAERDAASDEHSAYLAHMVLLTVTGGR